MGAVLHCERIVFVVDDDADIRDTLAELLEDEGYNVLTAANGRDALNKLRALASGRPCVILLDLMMPVMNGPAFYAALREDAVLASIPVVVLSADGNVAAKASRMSNEYLSKPLRIETLIAVVERHCA